MPSTTITTLTTPLDAVYMIGPMYARRLAKLELFTVDDLLHHVPTRYEDYSLTSPIGRLQAGETATVVGKIVEFRNQFTKRGRAIQKARISDDTGELSVIWFNQPFLAQSLKAGITVSLSGKADWSANHIVMQSPQYEIVKTNNNPQPTTYNLQLIHTGRLVPIYPETYGVSSKWLRSRIAYLLSQLDGHLPDYLPDTVRHDHHLLPYPQALIDVHFPPSLASALKARQRLAFDELLFYQLRSKLRRRDWEKQRLKHPLSVTKFASHIQSFYQSLPFQLTHAQHRVVKEILHDLNGSRPMNRLLEGDVGSGKTIVAAITIYVSYLNGYQSAVMAPTEILAIQHYETLDKLLSPLGITVELRTGSRKKENQKKTFTLDSDIIVGTHALLTKHLSFEKLGLVVIDEQHRFGVEQRAVLMKKGESPHLLTMTATPIPRTIALTLYGDLDLSYLDQLPSGRKRVKTWVVPNFKREAAYAWIKKTIKQTNQQAFIICPFIEESETLQGVKAAKKEYEYLTKTVFPDLKLALLHGKTVSKDKEKILHEFRQHNADILVATPVVEVGIDIPNATIILIEGAERYGLAQLHQLRGRVGRSNLASYCLLFSEVAQSHGLTRLKSLERIYIGKELAELDLKLRGGGDRFGTAQHGQTQLKIASLTDLEAIEQTQILAEEILHNDPSLSTIPLLRNKLNTFTIKPIKPN